MQWSDRRTLIYEGKRKIYLTHQIDNIKGFAVAIKIIFNVVIPETTD